MAREHTHQARLVPAKETEHVSTKEISTTKCYTNEGEQGKSIIGEWEKRKKTTQNNTHFTELLQNPSDIPDVEYMLRNGP